MYRVYANAAYVDNAGTVQCPTYDMFEGGYIVPGGAGGIHPGQSRRKETSRGQQGDFANSADPWLALFAFRICVSPGRACVRACMHA